MFFFLHSISIPSHFYSDHTVYHSPFPSSHPANHMCLPLTLAQTTTLLPGPISIPEELLRLILYGNVKGIPDIWVVKVPHRKHLGKKQAMWYTLHNLTIVNLKYQVCRRIYDPAFLSSKLLNHHLLSSHLLHKIPNCYDKDSLPG